MMEGMDMSGQEEYIWAMRYRGRESEREEGEGENEKEKVRTGRLRSISNLQDDHQTKVLASLVPDEIIYNVNDYSHQYYDACLLFGDVSGFTDLCEKYNKTGKGGPSRLTQVLNSYIGSMVQEIMSYNGDVLKFSGDAFLAMWKSTPSISMQDAVHEALDCALIIQKSYGTYETDVGVFLRVKLAVSAGRVIFSLIGDERFSHYVVIGQPIWDVKAAEHKSSAGETIVSHTAWNYINPSEYLYQAMSDGLHIKVHGLGPNWRSTQKTYRQNIKEIKEEIDDDKEGDLEDTMSNEEFSIRPSVNDAAKLKLKEDLRKFVIPPVMRAVDCDEPVEYLTEMRQIVILFLNIVAHKIEISDFVVLVDKCYKIVCRIVDSMHGCVNKVSLFDKDLMFVVIFGFRGFKHELESQVGLRCATEIYQTVAKVKNVKSASIGVTTGMTYCGVVGHTLRREYTVISLNVNKAARLMVAYPNKVTCDMETFLHSKLESRNFILQEHKELKGISRPGPVYEFKEVNLVERIQHNIHRFPILGRDAELQLYLRMLRSAQECFRAEGNQIYTYTSAASVRQTTLLLKGEARQGLTRLLDEMVYCTPSEIPINRFTLNSIDKKIPYLAIQLFFGLAMGISENSTDKDKREKLVRRLKNVDVPELFCVLNQVFSVNFEISTLYRELTNDQKKLATERMLKQLAYGCFSTVWVIAIDNVEQMDAESWDLINVLISLDIFLIVMTLGKGQQTALPPGSESVLKNPRVRTHKLPAIDKWFHAGLACQVLGVFAIPPELEKVIQIKSNGNPGWIENYLLSLTQGGGLQIRNVFKGDIDDLGIVVPPIEMLERQSPEKMRKMLEEMMEEESVIDEDSDDIQHKNYGWLMFRQCFRDSHTNLMRLKLQTTYIGDAPICIINPNYKIEEVDPELPMDVFIMKTFDSLTSFEQQLLKCSAVLGETFPRDMLVYIMGSAAPRPTALAVQKLFESKILTCAQGDFTQADTNMMYRQRVATMMQHIRCECKGLKIQESCADLPKYASCGYMRFRLPMFRDITYNLLTDNQKKDFHGRGVRYLEKETRKCRSCGNGYFVKFLGNRNDDLKRKVHKEVKKGRRLSTTSRESLDAQSQGSARRSSLQSDRTSIKSAVKRETMAGAPSLAGFSIDRFQMARSYHYLKDDWIGYFTIRRLRRSYSLARTFSNADFTNCQCSQILTCMYSQMLEHCRGAGLVDKLMDTMLEYAYVCILTYNIPHAMKILDDATDFVKSKAMDIDEEEQEWKIPLMIGKIKTMIGSCRLQLGQMKEAYECFTEAMVLYGYPFPTNKNVIKFYIHCIEFKLCLGLYVFPKIIDSCVQGYEAEFCDNVSECLSLLCNLFIDLELWSEAELAAAWSLNRCLKSKMDFNKLCISFGNMILVAHHMGRKALCVGLEVHGLRLCHKKRTSIESQELFAVVKMYAAIFGARFVRSEVEATIAIGFILSRMCATIHATVICLKVLPQLVHALLIRKRIMEAAGLLHELEYYAEEDIDNSGRTWFYALCVGINLETGYTVIPFDRCEKFFQIEGETMTTIRDPDAERRYYTVMWLWCVRNCEWEASAIWFTKARDFTISPDDNLDNAFTGLYLLEGLLLYLVCKMDKRNVKTIAHTFKDINDLIKILDTVAKRCRIIVPRLTHLKIYFKLIQDNDCNFCRMLNKAIKNANEMENSLEVAWMEHSEKAWSNNLSAVTMDFWRDHCDPDNLLDYHEIDFNGGKLGLFTLPQPVFM